MMAAVCVIGPGPPKRCVEGATSESVTLTPGEAAAIARAHWGLGLTSAVLVANPPPEDTALDAAVGGEIFELTPGATYEGPIYLRNRGNTLPITIRTRGYGGAGWPAKGYKVTPAHAGLMATVTPKQNPHFYDLGALVVYDGANVRYLTSSFQGNWKYNIFIRYAVLPRGGEPILFETAGSDLVCAKMDLPWMEGRIRPAITWRWSEGM
jgi:hypothetical protein